MNVSLTLRLDEYVRSKVDAGNYGNNSEVIREALRLMQERDAKTIQELRQKLIEAEKSGVDEDFSFDDLNAEIDEMVASERKQA